MAKYFIFNKGFPNEPGTLYRMAESDSALSNLNIGQDLYKVIVVSDDIFLNFRKLSYVNPIYDDNNNVTYTDISLNFNFSAQEYLEEEKKQMINTLDRWLPKNQNHPEYNQWNTFKTNISNIDASAKTYPLKKTIPQILDEAGLPYFHLAEIA